MITSRENIKSWYILYFLILILAGIGLNILLASTAYMGRVSFDDPYYFVKKQVVFISTGMIVLLVFSFFPYRNWLKFAWPIYGFTILLLVLVFVPVIGKEAGGASRWLQMGGFSMQPSDLARFAVVLVIARLAAHGGFRDFTRALVVIVIIIIPTILIGSEPDLGTAVHLISTAGVLLLFGGFRLSLLSGLFVASLPVLYYALSRVHFRWERIKAFLDPVKYRFEEAYQLIASYKSFLAGGLFGQGLGEGLRRHNLQARHTDFILAIVAEDTGFIGISLILALYCIISVYALWLLKKVEDTFGRVLGTGIILLFTLQAVMNIAVTMGLLPTTGINLPLLSYGGTSALTYLGMLGILINIIKENNG
ncbi:MAG: FtsW/RodA/SpoVE family cell cycle protein [Leptospirales bacterium]